jgi:hypothetical protein
MRTSSPEWGFCLLDWLLDWLVDWARSPWWSACAGREVAATANAAMEKDRQMPKFLMLMVFVPVVVR